MRKKLKWIAAAFLATALITMGALAAGTSGDPLVTLSYLNQVFAPKVSTQVEEAVKANQNALKATLDNAVQEWEKRLGTPPETSEPSGSAPSDPTFLTLTLTRGQTLNCGTGCEFIVREGNAAVHNAPGLVDTTSGTSPSFGAEVEINHLYLATGTVCNIFAAGDSVHLLVRGNYTVE